MRKIAITDTTSGIGKAHSELYVKTDAKIAIYKTCDIMDTNILTGTLNEIYSIFRGIDLMLITAGTRELNPNLSYELEEPTLKINVRIGSGCLDSSNNILVFL